MKLRIPFLFLFCMPACCVMAQNTAGLNPGSPNIVLSHLEVYNLNDFSRNEICSSRDVMEAPNWSRDGNSLLVNKKGLLFQIKLKTGARPQYRAQNQDVPFTLVLTGEFIRANNDHGYSPDGKWLAFSNWDGDGKDSMLSRIYVQPVSPGRTRLVTPQGPSYFHSWSPDGKTLAYCASRQKNYDIYTVPAGGGPEKRLTSAPGLDDGPDFSADGHFIYFNSSRDGTMKIWRMKADGSSAIKFSKGEGSDWFPHPSPDGRYVIYLNYLEDEGENHPACRSVRILLCDLQSGYTRAILNFNGGQGTINVPSWSPDGKHFAFVSYECR